MKPTIFLERAMRRNLWTRFVLILVLALSLALPAWAGDRVPGEEWLRYADPADAGFDAAKLEAAHEVWEALPSAAFMVIADGAVVAAWGDVERRFMCHSVRKSFLSALYGIYWDRGEIELNKTLADLGLDDEPDPLLEAEQRARILDLLKARSGVFHPAAYAGRTDSRPRGSEGPGRYFAYNNWDFNTLATILEMETGARVFEAFDEHFGGPLGMQDWRVSDGYYHLESDKSKYPAYPFRMSARDAARFGMLFTRDGRWGDRQILSRNWVRRSSALYSIDNDVMGYGFMWWVLREPRFAKHGMFAAMGVGNQMIAALPDSDLVIVNRANTYRGQGTPGSALLDLIEQVLEARTGPVVAEPALVSLGTGEAVTGVTRVATERLGEFIGEWPYPASPLGLPQRTTVKLSAGDGHLVSFSPVSGTFELYLQPDGSFLEEASRDRYLQLRDDDGSFAGIAEPGSILRAALAASVAGDRKLAARRLELVEGEESDQASVYRALVDLVGGKPGRAGRALRKRLEVADPGRIEAIVNNVGYQLLQSEQTDPALAVFELNTQLFAEAFNTWDSLGEAYMLAGRGEEAIRHYRRSLELNPENANATAMIERIEQGEPEGE
jgi:CubicO group peptidase (beta-lactamase class C family)